MLKYFAVAVVVAAGLFISPAVARADDQGYLSELQADGVTPEIADEWRRFYSDVAARNPDNPSAAGRAELMQRVLDLLTGHT